MRQPGEPLFLKEDTDGAVALADEERDTCPRCGYPKAWCREGSLADMGRFDVVEETCWPTYRQMLKADTHSDKESAATRESRQSTVRFKESADPDVFAGLGLD